ncbi:MAG TPA: ATP-binding protein [Stellaceae bacterium]|jgi:signal transduction histidine kinase|nr:ATP-binding protein [Stellaceae bacterium]
MEAGALRRSVLIIDDDGDFAESLAAVIEPHGYRVAIATGADDALAMIDRASPGFIDAPVVFVDVRLGVTSGVDVLARLRAERPDLICVVMTAELDTQTAIAALRRGAYDYFDKSCDPGTLLAVLDRCFDLVKLQQEREAAYDALRLAKEEAEAASRAKSGFLATVSHELRTPLNAIIGFSEMMLREVLGALGNEQYRNYVGDIHASGTHLLQIINDILDLSKAESGKLELYEDVFDLRDMIRAVGQLTSTRIRDAGLSNATHLPCDLPLLRADERKTKQVLLNLVTNAAKFTPPGGHIEIVGDYDDETGLALTVVDTGIGIAPDDIGRVLEPFVQVDSSLSRQHQGTGLGLPLVKAIIELHGGSLSLASTVGVGTRVTITFPPERAVFDAAMRQPLNAA